CCFRASSAWASFAASVTRCPMLSRAVRRVRRRLASSSITNRLSGSLVGGISGPLGCRMQTVRASCNSRIVCPNPVKDATLAQEALSTIRRDTARDLRLGRLRNSAAEGDAMNMTIWLPAMLLLALVALGLMFLFVE